MTDVSIRAKKEAPEGASILRWETGLPTRKSLVHGCKRQFSRQPFSRVLVVPSQDVPSYLDWADPSISASWFSMVGLRSLLERTFPISAGWTPLALGSVTPRLTRRFGVAESLPYGAFLCNWMVAA